MDYDLDLFMVAMLMGYLTRIETLEHDLRLLHAGAGLPRHLPDPLAQPRQERYDRLESMR